MSWALLNGPPTHPADEPTRTRAPEDDSATARLERRAAYSRAQARALKTVKIVRAGLAWMTDNDLRPAITA